MDSLFVNIESYKNHLKGTLSRNMIDEIAISVYDDISNFERVFYLIFDTDDKVAWRAAWACEKIIQKFPEIVDSKKIKKISDLALTTKHSGLHRLSLSILNSIPITEILNVELINLCFEWMVSSNQPVAVQALSLKLLTKYCKIEPQLIPELIAYLENFENEQLSPGMISCRKNSLKVLKLGK
ncbi:MAG: hypothetical protein ACOYM7_05440 [Paludibacter sp.]